MKKLAAILGIALSLLVVGAVSAHDATGVTSTIDCSGTYTVTVGYELFSDGHRLVTTIDADGVTVVKTETPTGAGTVTYTGTAKVSVDVTVTTPDDDNAPLTASAKAPTDCATPTTRPRPTPTPVVTPPATHRPVATPPVTSKVSAASDVASPGYVETLTLVIIGIFAAAFAMAYIGSRSSRRRKR